MRYGSWKALRPGGGVEVVLDVDGRRSSAVALSIVVDRQLEGFYVLTGIASSGEKFVSRGSQLAGRFAIEEAGGSGLGATHGHGMATTNLLLGTNRIDDHSRYRSVTTKWGER